MRHKGFFVVLGVPAEGVEATLVGAHRLLNNSPSVHASPPTTEQWHHDVNQLIVAAINTPHHEEGRQEPAAMHSRSPSVARILPSIVKYSLHL
jgi:hypothetical protein